MVNAQEWLDKEYPEDGCLGEFDEKNKGEKREKITNLCISSQGLEGKLDLSGFVNLKILDCSWNELSSLKLPTDKEKLVSIDVSSNKLNDLSIFSGYDKLKKLDISKNNFHGSLDKLTGLNNLTYLNIFKTQIGSGSLPDDVKKFWSSKVLAKNTKSGIDEDDFDSLNGFVKNIEDFRQKLDVYNRKLQAQIQVSSSKTVS